MDSNPQYLDMKKILSCIERSVRNGNPFSVVRVGHADMFAIKKVVWGEDISDFDRYRHYSGITDVDECAVRGIIRAVRNADVVGTAHHSARWQSQLNQIFDNYNICNSLHGSTKTVL